MKALLKLFYLVPVVVVVGVVGYLFVNRYNPPPVRFITGHPFATTPITNLTAQFFTPEGHLGPAANDVFIEFRDASGKLVDAGDVQFDLGLETPQAVTHSIFKVLRTSTPGQYRVNVAPQIVGEWKARLRIGGTNSPAEANFVVTVK